LLAVDADRVVFGHRARAGPADRRALILTDLQALLAAHRRRVVLADGQRPGAADADRLVLADRFGPVAGDGDGLVLVDGLGPVGIALEEVDDHLLTDARDVDRPPGRARPRLRHAHEARALLVLLPLAVPVELHLHAPVLVGPDLLALGADDDGGLRAGDVGL